ncbi:MAG: hypothetical protein CL912_11815 [Deltaproteobacteria bacterium]|nr:hypothetical protein [Deltaproteobacteria bacterium]
MSTPSRRKWPRKPIELRHESNGASSLSRSISPKGNFGFLIRNGWTELDKDLVSSRALDSVNEDYEDIGHAFLISRPLSRSEIQDYLERSISRNPKGIMPTYGRNINQFFNIPLRDNPYFTGRQRHLSRLDEILYPLSKSVTSHLRCAVLVGLGGGGKTEIAARYAHLHRNEYLAVLWIDGTSRGSLASSFSGLRNGLSRQMTIPGHQSSRSGSSESTSRSRTRNSSVNLVADYESMITSQMLASGESLSKTIHWLNSTHHRYHWLMIIDNLDDPDMVETIEDILVQLDRGCVIITSRNSGAAGLGTAVDVGELTSAEASEFLFRSLQLEDQTKAHSHQESVNSLCELLGYLALAIDQAVAYINENHLTIDEYIEIFQQQKADLLGRSSHNRYQRTRSSDLDGKYNTALTTWEISFRFVQHNSPAAALLLHLLAFMNNNDISEDIFRVIYDTKRRWDVWTTTGAISTFNDWENGVARALIQGMNSKPKFHEIVGKLLAFSLVKRTASRRRISIHPVRLIHAILPRSTADVCIVSPLLGICTYGTMGATSVDEPDGRVLNREYSCSLSIAPYRASSRCNDSYDCPAYSYYLRAF